MNFYSVGKNSLGKEYSLNLAGSRWRGGGGGKGYVVVVQPLSKWGSYSNMKLEKSFYKPPGTTKQLVNSLNFAAQASTTWKSAKRLLSACLI